MSSVALNTREQIAFEGGTLLAIGNILPLVLVHLGVLRRLDLLYHPERDNDSKDSYDAAKTSSHNRPGKNITYVTAIFRNFDSLSETIVLNYQNIKNLILELFTFTPANAMYCKISLLRHGFLATEAGLDHK